MNKQSITKVPVPAYIIVGQINVLLDTLHKIGESVYDWDNPEWNLSKLVYDEETDKFFFRTEEAE